jgi:hypothetical protein
MPPLLAGNSLVSLGIDDLLHEAFVAVYYGRGQVGNP